MTDEPLSLRLFQVSPEEVPGRAHQGAPMMAIRYGSGTISGLPEGCPRVVLDMPVLGGPAQCELWASDHPVHYETQDGFALARSDEILFGAIQDEEAEVPLERTAHRLYDRIFRLIEAAGYPHLLRVWNYLPAITALSGGMERYRRFTLGRHDAFMAHKRTIETAPAASALGLRGGPLTLFFIAGRESGIPLENPRQVSAYRYPERYGPRSPTFSRALLAGLGGRRQFFISGTASIVGHESWHPGDPEAQARETITNIRSLLAEARRAGMPEAAPLLLKAYVRDPASLGRIQAQLLPALSPADRILFVEAEICRPELLVEVEGVAL